MGAPRLAWLLASLGALLVLGTTLLAGSFAAWGFAVWALAPYLLLALAARLLEDRWVVSGAGAAALATELGVRAAVFVFPRGSTAAIALVFSPALIALVALPAGAGVGLVLGRIWRRGDRVARVGVSVVAAVGLGSTVLGLARPELFPTAVVRRRAALQRIGPTRVVTGSESFESVSLTDRPEWAVSADLDDAPGEELAIVGQRGARLLDATSLDELRRVEFGAEPGRLWNWYSTLARIDGRLVVVQTGGGYQATELRELDGRLLWSYHPDPELPPSALRSADLDGDGRAEFYATTVHAMVRLDATGHEVWKRPTRMSALTALAPRTAADPAWVVGVEYGRVTQVWDDAGKPLAEIADSGLPAVAGIVEWPAGRALVLAPHGAARGIDLARRTLFELPIGEDFTLGEALSLRFAPGAPSHLVLAATAARDVGRARLLVVSPARQTAYDEVLEQPVRLLKARRADGAETLLVCGDGGLRVLRPR